MPEGQIKPNIIYFGVTTSTAQVNEPLKTSIATYIPSETKLTIDDKATDYSSSVTWTGDPAKTLVGFKLVNVTSQSHGKLFGVRFFTSKGADFTQKPAAKALFISGKI